MSVRAALKCTYKFPQHPDAEPNPGGNVRLEALWDDKGKEPNNAYDDMYGEATPFARFEAYIANQSAFDQFEVGKFYFVDFTEAPDAQS